MRAAVAHERAAERHEQSAELFDSMDSRSLAREERARARFERERAKIERGVGAGSSSVERFDRGRAREAANDLNRVVDGSGTRL